MTRSTSPNPTLRAALYARVSSEEQARGHSLDAQQDKLQEFAARHEMTVNGEHVYVDDGYSGKNEHRPHLTRLFQDAEKKAFDLVLVYRLDRFFRNTRLLLDSVERLAQLGVGFKSITEPFDTSTPLGKYMLTNLGAIAELERGIILERKELGTRKAAEAGKWMGGLPPYGYRIDPKTKKLVVVPEEAKVVRMLFRWLIDEGISLFQIQKRLNERRIPTKFDLLGRDKPTGAVGWWRKSTAGRILANETYAGTFWFRKWKRPTSARRPENLRPKEDWVAIPTPAIVSKERFQQARKQLEENSRNAPRRTKRAYLLAKKLRCGRCSGMMSAQCRVWGKNRLREYRYYACYRTSRQHAAVRCRQKCVGEDRIAVPVWDVLKRLLLDPDVALRELEAARSEGDARPALAKRREAAARRLKQLDAKGERLLELYLEGGVSKSVFGTRSREIESEKESLVHELAELEQSLAGEEAQRLKAASLRQLYEELNVNVENADYETKRQVIDLLIERIVVHEDRLEVVLISPDLSQDPPKEVRLPLNPSGGSPHSAVPSPPNGNHVSLRPHRRVDWDAKRRWRVVVPPLTLSEARGLANRRYGLKRNLFHRDGRLKARLGGKPKREYSLKWHLERFRCPQARMRFRCVRKMILQTSDFKEERRKDYIAYIDRGRYNRFLLFPQRRGFRLAIKGTDARVEGVPRGSCDGIQTFFNICEDTSLSAVERAIREHAARPFPCLPEPKR